MMQNQHTAQAHGHEEEGSNIAHFPTRVIVAIAAGIKPSGVRICDLEKVIKHVVPKRNLRFFEIEKYAMRVLRHHVQDELQYLKGIEFKEGESEEQFFAYFEGLYGETLPIKGGNGAFL